MSEPTNRIRVQISFEISVHEPGLPEWIGSIVDAGVGTLIDEGKCAGPVILHDCVKYSLTRVTEASLKRRERRNG